MVSASAPLTQRCFPVKLWSTNLDNSVASIEAKANVCCVKFSPTSRYHLAFGCAGKTKTCSGGVLASSGLVALTTLPLCVCRPLRPLLRPPQHQAAHHGVQGPQEGRVLRQVRQRRGDRLCVSRSHLTSCSQAAGELLPEESRMSQSTWKRWRILWAGRCFWSPSVFRFQMWSHWWQQHGQRSSRLTAFPVCSQAAALPADQ